MADITPEPLFLSNSTATIGTDNYEAAINSVTFTPSTSTVTFKGLKPGSVFTRQTAATWVCELQFVQDWETVGSLSNYLHANEGTSVTITFVPEDGGPSVTATVIITPGAIGGAVDTFGVATVSLGVDGKPAIAPAA
jgi:hypothetical protein